LHDTLYVAASTRLVCPSIITASTIDTKIRNFILFLLDKVAAECDESGHHRFGASIVELPNPLYLVIHCIISRLSRRENVTFSNLDPVGQYDFYKSEGAISTSVPKPKKLLDQVSEILD